MALMIKSSDMPPSEEDTWIGVTDPAERRKRQNRLNQRLSRQRKKADQCHVRQARDVGPSGNEESTFNEQGMIVRHRKQEPSNSGSHAHEWMLELSSNVRLSALEWKKKVFLDFSLPLNTPSNLPNIVRVNLLAAMATNALTLSIPFDDLDQDATISPFNLSGPDGPNVAVSMSLLPNSLRPTPSQRSIVHHPWIDLLPIPSLRDKILTFVSLGLMDEDEFCHDLYTPDDSDGAVAPLAVWGDPNLTTSWEFSPSLFRKWGLLLQDCPELLSAINFWRQGRGVAKIAISNQPHEPD